MLTSNLQSAKKMRLTLWHFNLHLQYHEENFVPALISCPGCGIGSGGGLVHDDIQPDG